MRIIGLPAVGYSFKKEKLAGWVDARLTDGSIALTPRSLDPRRQSTANRSS
jgi:hypothetical protein